VTNKEPAGPELADATAEAIVGMLEGLDLLGADRALDDARRICWMKVFGGRSDDETLVQLGGEIPKPAIEIATRCAGLTLHLVEVLLMHARILLWAQNFARLPDTNFGQQHIAQGERAAMPQDKAKLN
jgi:hypothetical protein